MKQLTVWIMFGVALTGSVAVSAANLITGEAPFEATVVKPILAADVVLVKPKDGAERPIRLFGVAAPVAGQLYAQQAIDFIAPLVIGTPVTVEVLTSDNEGLPVAWVRTGEGPTINERLLQAGLVWWDEPNAPDANRLKKLAAEALIAGAGLWKDNAPLAPWDYRTSHNLPPVTYALKTEPDMEEALEPVAPETPTLAAKGTAKPAPSVAAPPVEIAPEDYLSLAAKHQPHIARDGQGNALGLTANDIANIPGASQVGFQNGDIVRSVNGITLTNEAQLFGLAGQLQGAKNLTMVVIRNGNPVTINIPL